MSISLNRSYVLSEVKGPVGLALRSREPFCCLVSSQKDKKKKMIKKIYPFTPQKKITFVTIFLVPY